MAWSLFNAFTEALKVTSLSCRAARGTDGLLDVAVGLN